MDSLRFSDFATTATSLIFDIGWPPESMVSGKCGVHETMFALLECGWTYEVTMKHIGSTFAKGEEDYDCVIGAFASSPKVEITDTNGLFGCNIPGFR